MKIGDEFARDFKFSGNSDYPYLDEAGATCLFGDQNTRAEHCEEKRMPRLQKIRAGIPLPPPRILRFVLIKGQVLEFQRHFSSQCEIRMDPKINNLKESIE